MIPVLTKVQPLPGAQSQPAMLNWTATQTAVSASAQILSQQSLYTKRYAHVQAGADDAALHLTQHIHVSHLLGLQAYSQEHVERLHGPAYHQALQ